MTIVPRPPLPDMVVDSSALVSLVSGEPSAPAIAGVLAAARAPLMSAATVLEAGIVVEARFGVRGAERLATLIDEADICVMPVDAATSSRALAIWREVGKGRHAAALNFGDCFVLALARHVELPILCIGDDFVQAGADVVSLSRGERHTGR